MQHRPPTTGTAHARTLILVAVLVALTTIWSTERQVCGHDRQPADLVLLDARVLTVDGDFRIAQAVAVRDGKIVAVGTDEQVSELIGEDTRVLRLGGKCVVPGLIETHCHALGVATAALAGPYVELGSIREVQEWIRKAVPQTEAGKWIQVPRTDITRLAERRHPTPAELDAACTTHPVVFTAARKHVLNSRGFKLLGATGEAGSVPGAKIIRGPDGRPRLMSGGDAEIRKRIPRPEFSLQQRVEALRKLHGIYNSVGITSIFERATNREGWDIYRTLSGQDQLTVRSTLTIRQQFRMPDEVIGFTRQLGLKTGDGDDWVRVGPLKITVDGGIHWGTTHLREPYGDRRVRFYALEGIQPPSWTGSIRYDVAQMTGIFAEAHRLGWQMCVHVTGDAGVDRVLDALDAAHQRVPLKDRRFTLTHAYFPARDSIRRAAQLGVCVDTQPYLYYKDSDAIYGVYGPRWAERFIGLGDWRAGGIPTAINADHMQGLDPDHSLQSFNPFLMLYIAVSRQNDRGRTYGAHQRLSRKQALRCVTIDAAYLSFDEQRKGSIEVGKLADLVVLDRDYLTCPVEQIKDIQVETTIVDGQIVWSR